MNITSLLHEKVILLENNKNTSKTTTSMYKEVLKTRASITQIGIENGISNLFEVVILKPPVKFKQTPFSALRWNNSDYKCKGVLKEYKGKYLKGIAVKLS